MFNIGPLELIVVFIVALVVIGPKKLPDLARALGKAIGEFKRATTEIRSSFDMELNPPKDSFKPTTYVSPPKDRPKKTVIEKEEKDGKAAGHLGDESPQKEADPQSIHSEEKPSP